MGGTFTCEYTGGNWFAEGNEVYSRLANPMGSINVVGNIQRRFGSTLTD